MRRESAVMQNKPSRMMMMATAYKHAASAKLLFIHFELRTTNERREVERKNHCAPHPNWGFFFFSFLDIQQTLTIGRYFETQPVGCFLSAYTIAATPVVVVPPSFFFLSLSLLLL